MISYGTKRLVDENTLSFEIILFSLERKIVRLSGLTLISQESNGNAISELIKILPRN